MLNGDGELGEVGVAVERRNWMVHVNRTPSWAASPGCDERATAARLQTAMATAAASAQASGYASNGAGPAIPCTMTARTAAATNHRRSRAAEYVEAELMAAA